jgi:DsbC/DsbD-like thiol-disulfide interchange protein
MRRCLEEPRPLIYDAMIEEIELARAAGGVCSWGRPGKNPGEAMRTLRVFITAALGLAAAAPAFAEPAKETEAASPWVELHASRARLVAGPAKTPDGARLAAVEIVMADGWKTYWRTPGDAGVPPQFDWSGSSNAGEIKVRYQAPMRIPEAGGEVIGYKHAVVFPVEVRPQNAAKPVTLKLALEMGICREICVPVVASLDLTLPPAGAAAPAGAIAAAVERVPRPQAARRPADPDLRQVSVDGGETGTRLIIAAAFHGAGGADVFVEAPDGLYVPMPRRLSQDGSGIVRFATDLSGDLARDLKGKTLTLTLVSEAGATEAQWTYP